MRINFNTCKPYAYQNQNNNRGNNVSNNTIKQPSFGYGGSDLHQYDPAEPSGYSIFDFLNMFKKKEEPLTRADLELTSAEKDILKDFTPEEIEDLKNALDYMDDEDD